LDGELRAVGLFIALRSSPAAGVARNEKRGRKALSMHLDDAGIENWIFKINESLASPILSKGAL
jgi:hypothetical protein